VAAPVKVTFEDTGHPGWDAIRFVHRLLMIDEPWTQWHDDGFSWWGHELAQRYRWQGPIDIEGLPTWFLSVETDFLRGATDGARALEFVNRWNASLEFGVGALVVEGERIRLRSRTYAMPESAEDRARLLGSWGIVANAVASQLGRIQTSDPKELTSLGFDASWCVDASSHPESGRREAPDEMLGIIGAMYIPEGRQPARETVLLGMDEAVHSLIGAGVEAVGGDFARVVLAQWRVPYGRLTWRLERAHQHPTLGYGVRSRLVVDLDRERYALSQDVAQRLNELEVTEAEALIGGGAWAVSEAEEPAALIYTAFFPNAGLRGNLAPMIAGNAWFRAGWLGRVLGETSAMEGAT
jgi:hypothetical protein